MPGTDGSVADCCQGSGAGGELDHGSGITGGEGACQGSAGAPVELSELSEASEAPGGSGEPNEEGCSPKDGSCP